MRYGLSGIGTTGEDQMTVAVRRVGGDRGDELATAVRELGAQVVGRLIHVDAGLSAIDSKLETMSYSVLRNRRENEKMAADVDAVKQSMSIIKFDLDDLKTATAEVAVRLDGLDESGETLSELRREVSSLRNEQSGVRERLTHLEARQADELASLTGKLDELIGLVRDAAPPVDARRRRSSSRVTTKTHTGVENR